MDSPLVPSAALQKDDKRKRGPVQGRKAYMTSAFGLVKTSEWPGSAPRGRGKEPVVLPGPSLPWGIAKGCALRDFGNRALSNPFSQAISTNFGRVLVAFFLTGGGPEGSFREGPPRAPSAFGSHPSLVFQKLRLPRRSLRKEKGRAPVFSGSLPCALARGTVFLLENTPAKA